MKKIYLLLLLSLVLLLTENQTKGQSFNQVMSQLTEAAAKSYIAPVSNGIGSNLNSGWMNQVPEADKMNFHLGIKIVVMGTFYSDDAKVFDASGQFYFDGSQTTQILSANNITPASVGQVNYNAIFNQVLTTKYQVGFSGPTVIGKKDSYLNVAFPGDPNIKNAGGQPLGKTTVQVKEVNGYLEDIPVLPFAAPQITVGTIFGTNISARYLSYKDYKNIGDISWVGFGGIHNPGVWFPNPLPVDIGIGYYQQNIKLGDIIENNSSLFGVYVGKTFGSAFAFIPYAGITVEKSNTKIKYTGNITDRGGIDVNVPINFELEGENTTGLMVGFTIKLGLININADYKVAKSKTATGGISLGW